MLVIVAVLVIVIVRRLWLLEELDGLGLAPPPTHIRRLVDEERLASVSALGGDDKVTLTLAAPVTDKHGNEKGNDKGDNNID